MFGKVKTWMTERWSSGTTGKVIVIVIILGVAYVLIKVIPKVTNYIRGKL